MNAVKLQFPKNLQKTGVTPGGGFLQPSTTFDLPEGKGLYPIFAIMSHYCVCNARYCYVTLFLLIYTIFCLLMGIHYQGEKVHF